MARISQIFRKAQVHKAKRSDNHKQNKVEVIQSSSGDFMEKVEKQLNQEVVTKELTLADISETQTHWHLRGNVPTWNPTAGHHCQGCFRDTEAGRTHPQLA